MVRLAVRRIYTLMAVGSSPTRLTFYFLKIPRKFCRGNNFCYKWAGNVVIASLFTQFHTFKVAHMKNNTLAIPSEKQELVVWLIYKPLAKLDGATDCTLVLYATGCGFESHTGHIPVLQILLKFSFDNNFCYKWQVMWLSYAYLLISMHSIRRTHPHNLSVCTLSTPVLNN